MLLDISDVNIGKIESWKLVLIGLTNTAIENVVHNPLSSIVYVFLILASYEKWRTRRAVRKKAEEEIKETILQTKITQDYYQRTINKESDEGLDESKLEGLGDLEEKLIDSKFKQSIEMLTGITKNVKGGIKTTIAGIALTIMGVTLGVMEEMEWTMVFPVIGVGVTLFLTPDPKKKEQDEA
jgi:hypothetical protein